MCERGGVRVIGIDELFTSLALFAISCMIAIASFAVCCTIALVSFPSVRIDVYKGMSRKT